MFNFIATRKLYMPPDKNIIKKNKIDLFKQEMANDLSFIYYGDFSDQINDALVPLAEVVIGNSNVDMKIRKRAFYIFVECIQNVNRHHCKEKRLKTFPKEIFSIRQKKDRFNIAFGNVLDSSLVGDLKSKIDVLNQTSVEDLNIEYKRILRDTILSKLGGAGLGLIEVARKSGNKIKYNFERLNDQRSYFSMETNVNEPNSDQEFLEFHGLEDICLYKDVFDGYKFGFLLKTSAESLAALKEQNLFSFLNLLEESLFFKVKKPESYINAIIEIALNNCKGKGKKDNDLTLQLETKRKNKYFNLCWAGKKKEIQKCADLLSNILNRKNFVSKKKQKASSDKQKIIELLSLLQGKIDEKSSLQLTEGFPGEQMLILQTPIEI